MPKAADLTGMKFGRLTAIMRAPPVRAGGSSRVMWTCKCDCGADIDVMSQSLVGGNTQSCGCLHVEATLGRNTRHGYTGTRTYNVWCAAKARCSNPNLPVFRHYGGRGISMCARWSESFEAFLADMGEAPLGLELDRIDNNGNYEPGNCRWTDRKTQLQNRRTPEEMARA